MTIVSTLITGAYTAYIFIYVISRVFLAMNTSYNTHVPAWMFLPIAGELIAIYNMNNLHIMNYHK